MALTQRATKMGLSGARVDDFRNFATGIGVRGIDKRRGRQQWGYEELTEIECRFIWRGSDMADRAVSKFVEEMFREGFSYQVPGDKDLSEELDMAARELGLQEQVITALKYMRAYGGCGIFLGADDGARDLSMPLREDRIRSFDYLTPFTPMELVPVTWYSDPLRPKFGTIETYRLNPLDRPPGAAPDLFTLPVIHESRIIPLQGVIVWRGQPLYNLHPGWGDSVFVRLRQVIADFEQAWGGAGILISDFAVATLKLKGLAELMAAGGASVEQRAQAIEDGRSVARTTIIDAEEEFRRETTTVTGLPELLDRMSNRLAAAMDLPVSLMMGQEPAGLNATGDSDIRWWYGTVGAQQRIRAKPLLERIQRLRFLARNGVTKGKLPEKWGVKFPSLWRPSETEMATVRLQQAQADQIYLQNQVVTAAEIARSRFGGGEYSVETQVDLDLRNELADEGSEADELGLGEEPKPKPAPQGPPPPAAGGGAPTPAEDGPLPKVAGENTGFPQQPQAKRGTTA